jgi:glycosyltransferase involved in cell wall biosynthesis
MRICLLSTTYPPANTEGIARQRQALAAELARHGHEVHVVTCGGVERLRVDQGVWVHEVPVGAINHFSQTYASLDVSLTHSQALYEGLLRVLASKPCDIVDVPLWSAQGLVTLQRYNGPTVLWLQTTSVQLLKSDGREPTPHDRGLIALERVCLESADSWLADSHVALETVIHDYGLQPASSPGVAYLGLPPMPEAPPARRPGPVIEALVVGRLEQRKGTSLLFEALPTLLHRYPQLVVRFVGRDNSATDGWRARHGATYPEFFQRRYPELARRVLFEGYLSDADLAERYQQAELLIAPSRYESFGLVYLEAMRSALPVVAFAAGGATEIFSDGEADGALLVPKDNQALLEAAIGRLVEQPDLRAELGRRGYDRFNARFSAAAMADATVAYYKQAIAKGAAMQPHACTIYQVMEALDVGDAVSNITRRNAMLLAELGHPSKILARYAHDSLKSEIRPIHQAPETPGSGLIFHYWGYNTSTWVLQATDGPKAVHYHNITPPHYFAPDSDQYRQLTWGYAQLKQIADCFDLIIGDSRYNIGEFARYMTQPKPALHFYPVIDVSETQAEHYDAGVLAALRHSDQVNLVFVGRIARNKRQDRLMWLFDHYYREINRHARLWLVGNNRGDPEYWAELERLRESLPSGGQIMFTGKVSDAEVNAYYRGADVFVCASEHEGFCMPLAQAMALDIPVLAYAAAAVPETLGGAGLLIHEWDIPRVAELIHLVVNRPDLRERLLEGQRASLGRFSADEARRRLAAIVAYLRFGEPSPLFESSAGEPPEEQPSYAISVLA